MISLRIGINFQNEKSIVSGDKVIGTIIDYLERNHLDNVAVIKSEFRGYSGENPTVEIIIPNSGQVVFGNVSEGEVLDILERYLVENSEIIGFLKKIDKIDIFGR